MTRSQTAIGAVVVARCTRTVRGLLSELPLGPEDGMPESFDNLHALRREAFRSRITVLSRARWRQVCGVLNAALGCPEHLDPAI
ncbi:MAG: type II toxin-antitoxin system PemK/MazF family toxin [Egibacteraceae bacterium]